MTDRQISTVETQSLNLRNPFRHAYTRQRGSFDISLPIGSYSIESALRNILQQRNIAEEMFKSTKPTDESARAMLTRQIQHLTDIASTLNNAQLSAGPATKRAKRDYDFRITSNTTKRLTPEEEKKLLEKSDKIRQQFGLPSLQNTKKKNPPLTSSKQPSAKKTKKVDDYDDVSAVTIPNKSSSTASLINEISGKNPKLDEDDDVVTSDEPVSNPEVEEFKSKTIPEFLKWKKQMSDKYWNVRSEYNKIGYGLYHKLQLLYRIDEHVKSKEKISELAHMSDAVKWLAKSYELTPNWRIEPRFNRNKLLERKVIEDNNMMWRKAIDELTLLNMKSRVVTEEFQKKYAQLKAKAKELGVKWSISPLL